MWLPKYEKGTPRGAEVGVRSLAPGDRAALREMLGRLSKETIYRRFHMPYPSVPGWMLDHIVAHRSGTSLVAVVGEDIVGHAMYAGEGGGAAEMAVLVEDAWQSRGIGKLLLGDLARSASGQGLDVLTGFALRENRRVLRLVEAVFEGAEYTAGDGTYEIRVPIEGLRSPAEPEGKAREEARPAA